MESKTSVFRDEFLPYIIKWGRGLNLFGVVLCFGPLFGLGYSGNCSSVGWLGCRFGSSASLRCLRLFL